MLNSSGMINGRGNVVTYPCSDVNRTVPYFKEFLPAKYPGNDSMADYMVSTVKQFNELTLDFKDKDPSFPQSQNLPDGTFKIRESNSKKLSYNMQVNDLKYWQYHRNNGITKIGLFDKKTNTTFYNLRSVEGSLTI